MTPTPEEEAVGAAPNFAGLDSLCSASGVCDPMGEYPECGRGSCADCRDDRVLLELEQREAAAPGDRGAATRLTAGAEAGLVSGTCSQSGCEQQGHSVPRPLDPAPAVSRAAFGDKRDAT